MTTKGYRQLTTGLIAVWFIFTLSASALHWVKTDPSRPPLPLLVAFLTPIAAFLLWYRNSTAFREFMLSLSPQTLTIVQSWRIAGFTFLTLYSYGILPGVFALPAGWGDIAIGATALIVAVKLADPSHKRSFILWQCLGIADLVAAVSLGAAAQFIGPQGFTGTNAITTAPMTVLPLSMIPAFAVPLMLILHIICIAQARRWSEPAHAGGGERAGSLAA